MVLLTRNKTFINFLFHHQKLTLFDVIKMFSLRIETFSGVLLLVLLLGSVLIDVDAKLDDLRLTYSACRLEKCLKEKGVDLPGEFCQEFIRKLSGGSKIHPGAFGIKKKYWDTFFKVLNEGSFLKWKDFTFFIKEDKPLDWKRSVVEQIGSDNATLLWGITNGKTDAFKILKSRGKPNKIFKNPNKIFNKVLNAQLPPFLFGDLEFMTNALEITPKFFEHASEKLRGDFDFCMMAMERGFNLKFASAEMRANRKIVEKAVSNYGSALKFADETFFGVKELVLLAFKDNSGIDRFSLSKLTPELRADRDIVLLAVEQCGRDLEFASPELQDDEEVVKTALKNFTNFHYISKRLRSNPEIVFSGLLNNDGIEYISDIFGDRDLALKAIEIDQNIAEHFPPQFLSDREFILAAMKIEPDVLRFASDELKADRDLVHTAVQIAGHVISYASDDLKADRDLVLIAVAKNPDALNFVNEKFRADREVVLTAVAQDGYVLEYATEELREDREFVLAAVKLCGYALAGASEALRKDREVVLVAVTQDGRALEFASDALKADRDLVCVAVKKSGYALEYASDKLRSDSELAKIALENSDEKIRTEYARQYCRDILAAAGLS